MKRTFVEAQRGIRVIVQDQPEGCPGVHVCWSPCCFWSIQVHGKEVLFITLWEY